MIGRKETAEGVLSFREAILARMAEMGIGSPQALARLSQGRVSEESLYNYLCHGTELSADRLESVFDALGIRLAVTPKPNEAEASTQEVTKAAEIAQAKY